MPTVRRSSAKKTAVKSRTYTVLRKSTVDPKKKLSSQGKTKTTTKSAAYLAKRVALSKRGSPSRVYLYRKGQVMTFSISYSRKAGKATAVATLLRTRSVKLKKRRVKKKRSTASTKLRRSSRSARSSSRRSRA